MRRQGHVVQRVPIRADLAWLTPCRRADVVFNLCEGVGAVSRAESLVAGALQLAGGPFTGASRCERVSSNMVCPFRWSKEEAGKPQRAA